MVKNKRVEL